MSRILSTLPAPPRRICGWPSLSMGARGCSFGLIGFSLLVFRGMGARETGSHTRVKLRRCEWLIQEIGGAQLEAGACALFVAMRGKHHNRERTGGGIGAQ